MVIAFYGDSLTEGKTGVSYFDILREEYPENILHNFGRGGDSAKSLKQRLLKKGLPVSSDIALLWVGVNDILARTSRLYAIRRRLYRKPWAKNMAEFEEHYQSLLDLLSPSAERLLTIPPLFIGEDIHGPWNRELDKTGIAIEKMTRRCPNAEFINLRHAFIRLLPENAQPYSPKKIIPLVIQALVPTGKDRGLTSTSNRGYHFTTDGIHLNQRGAEIAARVVSQKIKQAMQALKK